jgi:glycosyltransferase involved in cell wall biosynthesis
MTDTTAKAPLRVLHIITGLAAGGAEEQLRLLLPRLAEHGVSSEVAVFYHAGSVAQALRAEGIAVTDLHSPGFWDRRAVARLSGLIRAGGYDMVHTHLFRSGLHGRIAARRAGVRTLVHTEHSLNPVLIEGRRRNPAIDRLYCWAERRGTVTVAVSDAVAHELSELGVRPERIRVLPNGIDPAQLAYDPKERAAFRAEHGLAEDDFVVLCLGRLAASKRLDLAIEAVAEVSAARRPNVCLLVVGAGEELAALTGLAEQRLPGRAVFTGELPGSRLAAALSASDLLLSPSPEETFGMAVLSAAAVGLPVAFASCPALSELGLVELDAQESAQPAPARSEAGQTGPAPTGSPQAEPTTAGADRVKQLATGPRQGAPGVGNLNVSDPRHFETNQAERDQALPLQWICGTQGSLVRAIERALAAQGATGVATGAGAPAERRPAPALAAALHGYDIESIAARLAQLYRELLGLPSGGSDPQDNDRFSQGRRVGVHHV